MSKNKHRKQHAHEQFDEEYLGFEKTQFLKVKNFKPKTESQKIAQQTINENVLTYLGGPAGTGKTIVACYEALKELSNHNVKKIIITRPNVVAGQDHGHLPGTLEEKSLPFLIPLFDNFEIFIAPEKLTELLSSQIIEVVPIIYAQGRTFNDCFVIIDESQNMTQDQLRMMLTRIGFGSKCVLTFDKAQIVLKPKDRSCVNHIEVFKGQETTNGLEPYDNIGYFEFSDKDVVRSPIVQQVLDIYKERIEDG